MRYDVTWHIAVVKLPHTCLSIAFCSHTEKISHFAMFNPNKPINSEFFKTLIHDVYVDGSCEDARFCICLDCPFNRADLGFFKTKGIKTRAQLESVSRNIQKIAQDLKLKPKGNGRSFFYDKPLAQWTLKK